MASIPRLLASSSSFSSFNPAGEGRKEAVYVAAVPLRAVKGPAQIAVSAAYSAGLWNLQHWMVIIKPSHRHSQAYAFDFQPKDPEDIQVVLAALTQKQVPGVVLKRKIARLPKRRCWFAGFSTCSNQEDDVGSINVAENFINAWNTDLIIGKRDCRHFTNERFFLMLFKFQIHRSLPFTKVLTTTITSNSFPCDKASKTLSTPKENFSILAYQIVPNAKFLDLT